MSTQRLSRREKAQQLDALLDIEPSTAAKSDTYANNVEQLAQNAPFLPGFMRDDHLGEEETKDDYPFEIGSLNKDSEYSYLESLDDTSDYTTQIGTELDADIPDYTEEEPLDLYSLETEETEKLSQNRHQGIESAPRENRTHVLDPRSYAERNLRLELDKEATETDLDRVEKLAAEVYRE